MGKEADAEDPVPSTSRGVVVGPSPSSAGPLNLLGLPDVALHHLLTYLSYDEAAQLRRVSRRMDALCRARLNEGFRSAERFHARCMKEVKSRLPRRESERRNHPLSRHSDILTAVETRISLLSMTFMKYVDLELCCFIPGKVTDEIFRVLREVRPAAAAAAAANKGQHQQHQPPQPFPQPPRAFEVLQELRDISSMAMEYFDEKIAPSLQSEAAAVAHAAASSSEPPSPSSIAAALMIGAEGGVMNPFGKRSSAARRSLGLFPTPSSYGYSSKRYSLSSPPSAAAAAAAAADDHSSPSTSGQHSSTISPGARADRDYLYTKKLMSMDKRIRRMEKISKRQAREQKQELQDQSARIASLEGLVSSQRAVIAEQGEKIRALMSGEGSPAPSRAASRKRAKAEETEEEEAAGSSGHLKKRARL